MKAFIKVGFLALVSASMFTGCGKIVESTLKNNPDIIYDALKKDPVKFMDALNEAARAAQEAKRANAATKEKETMEAQFKNPAKVTIASDRAFEGKKDAPITIVEYSDFQCGYCGKAWATIQDLKKEYGDKIKFVYKHFPVTGAPMSKPAAELFEAIAMVDGAKAYAFHDKVFADQGKLRSGGEKYLAQVTKELLGSKADKVLKSRNSDKVKERLAADRAQAISFEISGTPAFVINGVFLKGAYPIDAFKQVIDRHLKAKN